MKDLLRGAYDLHVHTSPDVGPRKCDDSEFARRLDSTGMAGGAIKCHFNDTAARAMLLQRQFPRLRITGGVVLNRAVGGINPYAAESSAKIGGKMLWFPTMDSISYQRFRNPDLNEGEAASLLSACGPDGRLLGASRDVLEVALHYGMVVGTGHISPAEGMELAREAGRRKIRCVLTHADNPANRYSREQMLEAVQCGALVEFSFFTVYYARTPIEEIAGHIRALGIANVLLTSDFGQVESPYSEEGILMYMTQLLGKGFTEEELNRMFRMTPQQLIA